MCLVFSLQAHKHLSAADHPGARPPPCAFPSLGLLASSLQTGLGISMTFFSQRFGGMGKGWEMCSSKLWGLPGALSSVEEKYCS